MIHFFPAITAAALFYLPAVVEAGAGVEGGNASLVGLVVVKLAVEEETVRAVVALLSLVNIKDEFDVWRFELRQRFEGSVGGGPGSGC